MEWLRGITLLFTAIGIIEYIRFYIKKRQPAVLAPLSWLILVFGYTIFKWTVGNNLDYYISSVIWSNVILIQGVILAIAALVVFREYKPNGR